MCFGYIITCKPAGLWNSGIRYMFYIDNALFLAELRAHAHAHRRIVLDRL